MPIYSGLVIRPSGQSFRSDLIISPYDQAVWSVLLVSPYGQTLWSDLRQSSGADDDADAEVGVDVFISMSGGRQQRKDRAELQGPDAGLQEQGQAFRGHDFRLSGRGEEWRRGGEKGAG